MKKRLIALVLLVVSILTLTLVGCKKEEAVGFLQYEVKYYNSDALTEEGFETTNYFIFHKDGTVTYGANTLNVKRKIEYIDDVSFYLITYKDGEILSSTLYAGSKNAIKSSGSVVTMYITEEFYQSINN